MKHNKYASNYFGRESIKKKHNTTKIRVNEYVGIEEGERGWD